MKCPQCGQGLSLKASLYDLEVKNIHSDPQRRSQLAPPLSRSSIHLFVLGLLIWLTILYPAFAFERPRLVFWRDLSILGFTTSLWYWIWRRAQRNDRHRRLAYESTRICPQCSLASEVLTTPQEKA